MPLHALFWKTFIKLPSFVFGGLIAQPLFIFNFSNDMSFCYQCIVWSVHLHVIQLDPQLIWYMCVAPGGECQMLSAVSRWLTMGIQNCNSAH